jgi:REP element-mobilizing transposase RayT
MAGYYRDDMKAGVVLFDRAMQRQVIDTVAEHCRVKSYELYAIATDPTHIHILVGWRGFIRWADVRRALKYSISKQLNEHGGKRQWFARGGSRKQVKDRKHFDHLKRVYLPSHRGLTWSCAGGDK